MESDNHSFVLEVIACSMADALAAAQGGASRLEIISHFAAGGLTPPLDLVREIQAAVALPLRVMLRASEGYEVTDEAEIEGLCAAARDFTALKVDGLVLGFLRAGKVDHELLARILACAPQLPATFHHAFDEAQDQFQTIAALKQHARIDRILTSGGSGDWSQKRERLERYQRAAAPEITILAGGGVDAQAISLIRQATTIHEFHVGSAARYPPGKNGIVQPAQIRELVRSLAASAG